MVSLVPLSSGGGFGLELESSELAKKYVESSTRHHLDFSHLPRSLARVVVWHTTREETKEIEEEEEEEEEEGDDDNDDDDDDNSDTHVLFICKIKIA